MYVCGGFPEGGKDSCQGKNLDPAKKTPIALYGAKQGYFDKIVLLEIAEIQFLSSVQRDMTQYFQKSKELRFITIAQGAAKL